MSLFLDDRAPIGPLTGALLGSSITNWQSVAEHAVVKAELLSELVDYIAGSDPDILYQSVLSAYVENVEPRVFTAISTPDVQLAVNLFPAPAAHNRLIFDGVIGPHSHERSFVSRILVGGYTNMIYKVVSPDSPPTLELERNDRRAAGSVDFMHYAVYHSVVSPAMGTMSVVVRGPVMVQRNAVPAESYTPEIFRAHRDEVLNRLVPMLAVGAPSA